MKIILSLLLVSSIASAAVVSRIHTFTDGSILTSSQLNTEFNNLVDNINALDNDNLSNSANIDPKKISATVAGDGIGRNGSTGVLAVNVDGSTIETNSDSIRVKDGGITSAKLDSTVLPVGTVLPYAGSSAPTGWLLCQGQAVSRTTYATLFALIGTTYGSGDGSTTFNLPDLKGRAPIGSGTGSGLTARTLGQKYGAETETIDASELPSHTHNNSLSDGGHTHTIGTQSGTSGINDSSSFTATGILTNSYGAKVTNSSTSNISITNGTNSTSNTPISILQPVTTVNFMIKY